MDVVWNHMSSIKELYRAAYSPMLDIWSGLERSSKTGQGKKSLISTFACFLTATAKV